MDNHPSQNKVSSVKNKPQNSPEYVYYNDLLFLLGFEYPYGFCLCFFYVYYG